AQINPGMPSGAFIESASGNLKVVSMGSSSMVNAGGVLVGTPASADDSLGNIYVAGLDSNGTPWLNIYMVAPQSWIGWQTPGATYVGKPALAVAPNGVAYSCYRDVSGYYWLISYRQSSGFGSRQNLGRLLQSDPVLAAAPDSSLYLLGIDSSSAAWGGHVNP